MTQESDDAPGTFQNTDDIRLYGTFGVPLVHGWVASPASEADGALKRVAQYYEDVQLLPFRKQELEDRVFRGETLTWDEEQAMKDIHAIERFTEIENATQLSPFGLDHLTEKMHPGTFSILFATIISQLSINILNGISCLLWSPMLVIPITQKLSGSVSLM